ncbi:MAG: glycosyltransferase family 2 protein [Gemmatimonadota bacterium]
MNPRKLVSVVIPVLNEVDTLDALYGRLLSTFERASGTDFEVVFVDDGSSDGSRERIRQICARDPRIRLIELSRNFGHQLAITAGIDHSAGDGVVVMDGDLQDPPEVILDMLERWEAGADVVYGVREARLGESSVKRAAASVHYRLLRWLSETEIPLDSGDFRLISRQVADALGEMRESSRYLRGMVAWLGFRQEAVHFQRDPRYAGEPKYNFRSLLKLSLDGITSFTDRPLKLASQLGLSVTGLAVVYASWIIVAKLLDPTRAFQGFSAIMVVVLFLGGVQLFSIGILGQYLARVYTQSKGRPLYVVGRRVGWEADPPHRFDPTMDRTFQDDALEPDAMRADRWGHR